MKIIQGTAFKALKKWPKERTTQHLPSCPIEMYIDLVSFKALKKWPKERSKQYLPSCPIEMSYVDLVSPKSQYVLNCTNTRRAFISLAFGAKKGHFEN